MTTSSNSSGSFRKPGSFDDNVNRAYLRPFLNKKYAVAHCDGKIDDVMRALGVGALRRAMFRSALQRMELTERNGVYTLHIYYAFRELKTQFRIGEEFDDWTPINQKVRSVVYQDKTKLTFVMRAEKVLIIEREFILQPEHVLTTVLYDDIVAKRIYKPFTRAV